MLDRKLILLMFENNQSYAQIARSLGVSRQRIHQILTDYVSIGKYLKYKPKRRRYKKSFANKLDKLLLKNCQICKRNPSTMIHHKDHNSHNNTLENLISICPVCHYNLHLGETGKKLYNYKSKFKPWSKTYIKCAVCGDNKSKHRAFGLCSSCYCRYWKFQKRKKEQENL